MLNVDDSELGEDDREFLKQWAETLQVPIGVLVLRIVEAAIDGDQYIEMRPRDWVRPVVAQSTSEGVAALVRER